MSADGKPYPVRNRLSLCRCGKSGNTPFCDGSHVHHSLTYHGEIVNRPKNRRTCV
ncbi:MAG: CDGSH iron-sulfur domain-containing protein [Methanoregula sp.]|nr:CDGSH iron-sulfur domain-containing protein [Methanoregula sp.]